MERTSYCIYSAESSQFEKETRPAAAKIQTLGMDASFLENCMVTEAGWYREDCFEPEMVKHPSSEVLMFLGSDPSRPADLNATIEIWLENDKITMTQCCAVFIPAGVAHGKVKVENLTAPVAYYSVQPGTDAYVAEPAEANAPEGTYAHYMVERFEPSNGYTPNAPEGLLTPLVWIDGGRIDSAPYAEAVWFNRSSDEGPAPHTHDYDEFLSFLGTDPANPTDLGCTIEFFVEGERIDISQSCLIYIPAGVVHNPFYIRNMTRPILHTSGYAGTDYQRTTED